MSTASSNGGGVGFLGLLTVLFVGLKLTGFINWSWWWVLAPLWGGIALALLILAGVFMFLAVETRRKPKWGPKK